MLPGGKDCVVKHIGDTCALILAGSFSSTNIISYIDTVLGPLTDGFVRISHLG